MSAGYTALDAKGLIDKISRDADLSPDVQRVVGRLSANIADPDILIPRLQQLASDLWRTLPRELPRYDLLRVVPAHTFWAYLAKPSVRATFTTVEDFSIYVGTSDDPSELLMAFLADDPITFLAERSWLAEAAPLRRMTGEELSRALEIDRDPPLVVFHLPLDRLLLNGVTVRKPCSLDSAVAPNLQWRETGLASGIQEYVDGDIPRSCIDPIEWKPR